MTRALELGNSVSDDSRHYTEVRGPPSSQGHDHHNDHRAHGANDHRPSSRCDRRVEELRGHNPVHGCGRHRDRRNDARVYMRLGWSLKQRSCAHRCDHRGGGVGARHVDSQCVRRGRWLGGHSRDREHDHVKGESCNQSLIFSIVRLT